MADNNIKMCVSIYSFQSKIYECLANCQCCPQCQECPTRYRELDTEVLVKVADIMKALDNNRCNGNPSKSHHRLGVVFT